MIIKYTTNALLLLTFVARGAAANLVASPRGLRAANETNTNYEQQLHVAHLHHHEDLARAPSNKPAVFYGRFWYDNNFDGKFNKGKEQGVKGGTVSLKRKTVVGDRTEYKVLKTRSVRWDGKFEIRLNKIKANSEYYLKFVHSKTAYYKFEPRSRGGDSHVRNQKGDTDKGSIKYGEKYRLNAGLVTKKGAMFYGRMWLDKNGNGEIDKGEKGFEGGSVALYQQTPSGKKFIKKKKVNSDGTYEMPVYQIQKDTKYFVKLYGHDKDFVYSPKLSGGDSHVKTKNGSSWPRIVEEGKRYNVNAGITYKPDPTPEPTVPPMPDPTPEPTAPPKPDPEVCANYELFNRETKTPLQGSCDAYDQIYRDLCPPVDTSVPYPQYLPPGGKSPTCEGYCCGAGGSGGSCPEWEDGFFARKAFPSVIVPECDGKEKPDECEIVLVRGEGNRGGLPYAACSVSEGDWIYPSINCWTGNDLTTEVRIGVNTKVTLDYHDFGHGDEYIRTESAGPELVPNVVDLTAVRVDCTKDMPDPTPAPTPPTKPPPEICTRYDLSGEVTKGPLIGSCEADDQMYKDLCPPVDTNVPKPQYLPPGGNSPTCEGYCCGASNSSGPCPNSWNDSWMKAFPSMIVPACDGKEEPGECEVVLVRKEDNDLPYAACSVGEGEWFFPSIECWTGKDLTDEVRIGLNTKVVLSTKEGNDIYGQNHIRTESTGPSMVSVGAWLASLRVECISP